MYILSQPKIFVTSEARMALPPWLLLSPAAEALVGEKEAELLDALAESDALSTEVGARIKVAQQRKHGVRCRTFFQAEWDWSLPPRTYLMRAGRRRRHRHQRRANPVAGWPAGD